MERDGNNAIILKGSQEKPDFEKQNLLTDSFTNTRRMLSKFLVPLGLSGGYS